MHDVCKYPGIERDKTMANKFMYISRITPSVDYNSWFKRLDTELSNPTNKINKSLKEVKSTNNKTLL